VDGRAAVGLLPSRPASVEGSGAGAVLASSADPVGGKAEGDSPPLVSPATSAPFAWV
jgi:hypothetical protein